VGVCLLITGFKAATKGIQAARRQRPELGLAEAKVETRERPDV